MRAALSRLEEQLAGLQTPVPLPGGSTATEQGVAAHIDMCAEVSRHMRETKCARRLAKWELLCTTAISACHDAGSASAW